MVMKEMEKPRDTFILARGDYRNRGEKVTPGVPSVLPPMPAGLATGWVWRSGSSILPTLSQREWP